MYSVVLLMALSSGTEAADFGRKSCNGCNGCNGCYVSCSGCNGCYSSCSGCYSSCNGCNGCSGKSKGGLFGGLFGKKSKGCNGCNGCNGCYASCSGCNGCYSGCHGAVVCTGCHGAVIGCTGCTGCHGAVIGCHAAPTCGTIVVPATKEMPKTGTAPAPAKIIVSLPADAKLMIDDYATTSTSASRVFVTPELDPAKEYTYTLKAEAVINGKAETKTETVTVRGGRDTTITINFAPATVASK